MVEGGGEVPRLKRRGYFATRMRPVGSFDSMWHVPHSPGHVSRAHRSIAKDLDIYKELPEASSVKSNFLTHIERRVEQLSANDSDADTSTNATRSGSQIALGITILILAIALGLLVVLGGGWWWLVSPVVLFLLALGGVGLVLCLKMAPRDEKGNLVK